MIKGSSASREFAFTGRSYPPQPTACTYSLRLKMSRGRVGRRQEFSSELMIEALAESHDMADAAKKVGCSAPLLTARADIDPDVRAAIKKQEEDRVAAIATSILTNRGNVSKVALDLGYSSRQAVVYHIGRSAVLTEIMDSFREGIVDSAEDNIFGAVQNGDLTYSWKVLQTLGKNRGYTERKEVDQTVTHSLSAATSGALVGLLDRMANTHPEAVEADFSELSDEERLELSEALEVEQTEPAG